MARFRLRRGTQEIELPPGDFVIGRGAECQLTLDDPLVSRRHAVIHVGMGEAVVEDLGSRNGVVVNGTPLKERASLQPGDVITIGTHQLVLTISVPSRRATVTALTQSPVDPDDDERISTASGPARVERPEMEARPSSGGLLLGIAAKALQLGRFDDAERIFGNVTAEWKRQPTSRAIGDLDELAGFAVLLASATNKSRWVDWLFDAYRTDHRVLPPTLIDELHAYVRKSRYAASAALRSYVDALRALETGLDPSSRFLLKRIEGLLEVASAN